MHSVQSLLPTILLFLYFASMPSSSSYYRYASCAPSLYTCGSKNLSINYPFRVDSRPDFCGHPGYYISCSKINSAMMITINDKGYQVIDVDYLNHLITVVDQLFLAQPCPRPYENTSIASSLYSCSDRDRNVALFVNCSALAPTPADVVELVCAVGPTGKHWYYKVKNDMNGELVGRCSSTVMVPVHQPAADELASGKLSFGEAVSKGFSVKWTAGEGWCSDCVNSGGRCGFEGLTTIDRTCYCLYGAAVGTCSSKAKAALVQTPSVGDCETRSCGNGVDITFPFWLSGQQKSYCGYPAFEVSCKNRRTVLEIIDHSFYLHHIFYNNRSVVLTAVEFENDQCPLPYTSFGTNSSIYPFAMSPQNTDIYFLLNCSHDLTGYESINCSQTHGAYFAGTKRPENTSCDLYFVPVLEYSEAGNHDYKRALRSGWLMTWTMPDCDGCMRSGGRCGYNESTASISCICHDQIYPDICRRGAHKKTKVVVIGTLAAACVLVLSCTCLILYGHKKKKGFCLSSKLLSQNASFKLSKRDPGLASAHIQTHIFSYDELHKATDCFNASNELGGGGFGTVYKGKLQDGRTIAVKRLYENNSRRLEQFMNEIDILSRLQHPNLVNLYGCTSPISQSLLLVYEFVPNGTLADHLHGLRANERILTWAMRLNIAIETAHALAYLHSINPPIIHRDVKTCNILLDSSFHVKVADFGLSRLIPIDAMHVSTAPQGTPGYLDPEYHRCYQLTDKSDVYSFGVVLLELISSKPAIDMSRNRSDITLANMAITRIQNGELEQLVDASLGYISDQTIRKMMTMVAELAFRCLQFDGDMRPPIKEVLEVLKAVEGEWHKVDNERIDSTQNQADAELLKNTPPFSPDSVMKKWASRNTTPNTTE